MDFSFSLDVIIVDSNWPLTNMHDNMAYIKNLIAILPFLGAGVEAAVSFPPLPSDLSTPVQQRIAFGGPNSMSFSSILYRVF